MSDEGGSKKFKGTKAHFVIWDILFKGQACSKASDTTSNCIEHEEPVRWPWKLSHVYDRQEHLDFSWVQSGLDKIKTKKGTKARMGTDGNTHWPFPIGSLRHTGVFHQQTRGCGLLEGKQNGTCL